MSWTLAKDKEKYGVVIADYLGTNEMCLNLAFGDSVHVLEVCGADWAYGYVTHKVHMKGIFPRRFVVTKDYTLDRSGPVNRVIPKYSPIVQELTASLREWKQLLRQSFMDGQKEFKTTYDAILNLIDMRKDILSNVLPLDELKSLNQKVALKIDQVNRILGLDLVVRDDQGNILNTEITSTPKLLRQHKLAEEALTNVENRKEGTTSHQRLHHSWAVHVHFTNIIFKVPCSCEVSVSLFHQTTDARHKMITEPYVFHWTPQGYDADSDLFEKLQCMYTDLNMGLLTDKSELWLVGVVVQEGRCVSVNAERRLSISSAYLARKSSTLPVDNVRRPFGVFVLDISSLFPHNKDDFSTSTATSQDSKPNDRRAKFSQCGERECIDSVIRRLLMKTNSEVKPADECVCCSITLHNGDINTLRREQPYCLTFKKVALIPRLSLAEKIVPGYVRNDLYVNIKSAEIFRWSKINDKNIEVTVRAYSAENKLLKGVLSCGVGKSSLDEYRTLTYHHEAKPRWMETVKVTIPIDQFEGAHLRFLFCHRSMNESKGKQPRPFALAFVKLMQSNGTTLNNEEHELYMYNLDAKKWKETEFDYLKLPGLRARPSQNSNETLPEEGYNSIVKSISGMTSSSKDTFLISTTFCSTKLTQNEHLLALLRWSGRQDDFSGDSRSLELDCNGSTYDHADCNKKTAEELKVCLSELRVVPREELLIFLQDTLDVLFHLLTKSSQSNAVDEAVFEALIEVVYIAGEQHKGETLQQSALNSYIECNFSATLVYGKLIALMKEYVDRRLRIPGSRSSLRAPIRINSTTSLERIDPLSRYEDTVSLPDTERIRVLSVSSDLNCDQTGDGENVSQILNKMLKCLPYFVKFIVKSRKLYAQYYVQGHDEFCKSLESLFSSLSRLLTSTADVMLTCQGQCLRYLPDTIPDIMSVLDSVKLSNLLVKLLENIPFHLMQQKLNAIKQIVHKEIFSLHKCRELLLKSFIAQLKKLFDPSLEMEQRCQKKNAERSAKKLIGLLGNEANPQELNKTVNKRKAMDNDRGSMIEIVVEILEDIIIALHDDNTSSIAQQHMLFVSEELIADVLSFAVDTPASDPLAARYVGLFIGLVRQVKRQHLSQLLRRGYQHNVHELVSAIQMFIENSVFKPDWSQMNLLLNNVLLTLLQVSSDMIAEGMKDSFNKEIWSNWFNTAVKFITQPTLQLEKFSPSKRNKIKSLYQDMRKDAAFLVLKMWNKLDRHKLAFIVRAGSVCLIAPVLELTLIPEPELRNMTIPVFFDMMQCEYYSSSLLENDQPLDGSHKFVTGSKVSTKKANFDDFENEMLVRIDQFVGSGSGDDHYCCAFSCILNDLCDKDPTLQECGKKFVATIKSQLTCLLQYRSILDDPENSVDTRMSCTAHLLDFYSSFENKVLYVRYVYKLVELHAHAGNHTEAGFALYEHAKILEWNCERLPQALVSPKYPYIEYHRQLKEQLYEDIIKYMEAGNMWECALDRSKELREHYEITVMDYKKLSELLDRMAVMYRAIIYPKEVRSEPEYFRVAYYGRGFPGFLQNKIFVHRGNGFERLSEFQARLLDQFPNAELLTTLTPPDRDQQESPEQYILVNKVECIIDPSNSLQPGVSEHIRSFYRVNNVKQFTYSRPYHEGTRVKDNEFATLCLKKTTLFTECSFPGILRCFRVVKENTINLSPIENAIHTMRSNNSILSDLVQSHHLRSDLPLDSLTRKLSGMIDAAVMGGVSNYEKAFLQEENLIENKAHSNETNELKQLIREMVPLLHLGLQVHGDKVSGKIVDLHDHMLKKFIKMKDDLCSKYGSASFPDLQIPRKSLQLLRQSSYDSNSRSSQNCLDTSFNELVSQRLSIGSGTLQRNKSATSSLPIQTRSMPKIKGFMRGESFYTKEGNSLFYRTSVNGSKQPLIEISETPVSQRASQSELHFEQQKSQTNSSVSATSSSPTTPTHSTGGSIESLSLVEQESKIDVPPLLPKKIHMHLNPDRNSRRIFPSHSLVSLPLARDSMDGSSSTDPPEKPPRPPFRI